MFTCNRLILHMIWAKKTACIMSISAKGLLKQSQEWIKDTLPAHARNFMHVQILVVVVVIRV